MLSSPFHFWFYYLHISQRRHLSKRPLAGVESPRNQFSPSLQNSFNCRNIFPLTPFPQLQRRSKVCFFVHHFLVLFFSFVSKVSSVSVSPSFPVVLFYIYWFFYKKLPDLFVFWIFLSKVSQFIQFSFSLSFSWISFYQMPPSSPSCFLLIFPGFLFIGCFPVHQVVFF